LQVKCNLCLLFIVFTASQITSEMMQNPQVLAALQQRLDSIVGTPSGYIDKYVFCFHEER